MGNCNKSQELPKETSTVPKKHIENVAIVTFAGPDAFSVSYTKGVQQATFSDPNFFGSLHGSLLNKSESSFLNSKSQ